MLKFIALSTLVRGEVVDLKSEEGTEAKSLNERRDKLIELLGNLDERAEYASALTNHSVELTKTAAKSGLAAGYLLPSLGASIGTIMAAGAAGSLIGRGWKGINTLRKKRVQKQIDDINEKIKKRKEQTNH